MNLCKISVWLTFLFVCITLLSYSQKSQKEVYDFKIIDNGPFEVKTYTLDNGLQLFLVSRDDEPRIHTRIVVKAGSNQDPEHTRGLAHYLEHLLFNGTDKLGAINFQKEKPLIDKIEILFEDHRNTSDEATKRKLYKQIDSLSFEASKYSKQSEYTDLMREMGIGFLNAFTRTDITGYMNSIPSNQLEKWVSLEAERFRNPVFRGFHTELETVYEEMNARSENGYVLALQKLKAEMLTAEYYQETIGTAEGLKNPSLLETKKFFETYYVPNNMAIIMSGDFDPHHATRLIENYFGDMQPKDLPVQSTLKTPLLNSDIRTSITSPEKESLTMLYVFEPANHDEAYIAEFTEMLFLNGDAGIGDIGEVNNNSNWFNSNWQYYYDNFSLHFLEGEPKNISLEELEQIILNDIDRLKTGNFPDWLLEATANEINKRFLSYVEFNGGIVSQIVEAYARGISMDELFEKQNKFHTITKQEIMDFANKYYDHYGIIYKRQGDKSFKKLEKPEITGISDNNSNVYSQFGQKIRSIPVKPIKPKIVNFDEVMDRIVITNNVTLNYIENTSNDKFNLKLVFKNGGNKVLMLANDYIKQAGTNQYSTTDLKSELFKLGARFNFVTNAYYTTLYLNGLSRNFKESWELLAYIINHVNIDGEVLESIKQTELHKIENEKTNKGLLFNRVLDYVSYGNRFKTRNFLTKNDIVNFSEEELVEQISNLFNNIEGVYYYGANNKNEIISTLQSALEQKPTSQSNRSVNIWDYEDVETNNIFLLDHESKQIDIGFVTKLQKFDKENHGLYVLFKEYLGNLINREIREKRGLAYSADNTIKYPNYADESYLYFSKVGTQTDKFWETLEINHKLINEMPLDPVVFNNTKLRLKGIWDSQRIVKFSILDHYERAVNRGLDYDYRKHYINDIENLSLDDLEEFYNENIRNKKFNIIIIGELDELNKEKLSKYGKIKQINKDDLFEQ